MNILHQMLRFAPLLLLLGFLAGAEGRGQSCFQVTKKSATCGTGGDAVGYTGTVSLRGMAEFSVAYVEFSPLTANVSMSSVTKTISPAAAPGDTIKNLSFVISGSGATAGATVKVLARIANGSSRTSISCSDTITFVMPDCTPTCMKIINESVACNEGPRGTNYIYSFDAINGGLLAIPGAELYYSVISPAQVSAAPAYQELQGGFSSGDTITGLSVTLDGAGITPGATVKLRLNLCNDGICCADTVEIVLPECGPAPCFEVLRQEISCGLEENDYDLGLALKNISSFTVGTLVLYSAEATFNTPFFNVGAIKPGQALSQSVTMNVPKEFQGKEITVTALLLGGKGDSCSSSFTLAIPECAPRGCFSLSDTALACVPTTNGNKAYGLTFTLHNESARSVRWINLSSKTPNVVVGNGWIDLGTSVPPGGTMAINTVGIGGPGVQVGAEVKIGMSLAGASSTDLVCSDSFAVVLPECGQVPPPFEGCYEFMEETLTCITSPTAPPGFAWSFVLKNGSNRKLDSLKIVSVQSSNGGMVQTSQKVFTFVPAIAPGETASLALGFSGPGAVDGAVLTINPQGFFEGENALCRTPHELDLVCEKGEEEKPCFSLGQGAFQSVPTAPQKLNWSFTLTNESDATIDRLLLASLTPNVTLVEGMIVLDEPVMPGESQSVTATLAGGTPGQTVDIIIGMASASPTNVICTDTVQTVLPEGQTNSVAERGAESAAFSCAIFPNPARESASLRFVLESSARSVTVTAIDATGREVLRPVDERSMKAGEHLLLFDTDLLPAGAYIIVVNVDGRVETSTLNVLR